VPFAGEAIGAPAAIANTLSDALMSLGFSELPMEAERPNSCHELHERICPTGQTRPKTCRIP